MRCALPTERTDTANFGSHVIPFQTIISRITNSKTICQGLHDYIAVFIIKQLMTPRDEIYFRALIAYKGCCAIFVYSINTWSHV